MVRKRKVSVKELKAASIAAGDGIRAAKRYQRLLVAYMRDRMPVHDSVQRKLQA